MKERQQRIAVAIVGELERQAAAGVPRAPIIHERFGFKEYDIDGTLDIEAIAIVVDSALDLMPEPLDILAPNANDRRTGRDRRQGNQGWTDAERRSGKDRRKPDDDDF
ncbi:hypothetical protein [Paradevosia shaoguanensis]|uniref:Uncharacterized protein n=1 Tax=Paradevosia shaoguanensis TaxID=1335043 RepID=A0AA41QKT2_9HYPH|nr:hypothetical protein [Paradevosia shaoguanensis]KFL25017.1 hypothetical protein JP74_21445 [Devosia sp. 17-2-E-8]QMV03741.1 hypothetical protein GHV40_20610 [Devosia sp. D6-9]CDP53298.1 hypothetical protein [Devosia sp. DBB001]MCF1740817.1 hypothetical protein [Paradevosia shaoguanensis]MCI0125301.1 hypothetical protein [Paradevosia shaoguanensis]